MRRLIKRQRKPYFHKPEGLKRTLFKRLRPPKDFTLRKRGLKRPTIGKSELEKRAVSEDKVIGTLPERIVYRELLRRRITFDFQSSLLGGRLKLGGMVADFILYLPLGTLILRVQTQYFHTTHEAKLKDDEQRAVLESLRDPISGKYYIVYDLWDHIVYDSHRLNDWLNRVLSPKAHTFYLGGPGRGVWMPNRAEWEALVGQVRFLMETNAVQELQIEELLRRLSSATLSGITHGSLGLMTAGEFRAGDSKVPGVDFTGVRMYYGPANHTGAIEGQASGVKQFYLDTDGKAYAGAGDVVLDANGITIDADDTGWLRWLGGSDTFAKIWGTYVPIPKTGRLVMRGYGKNEASNVGSAYIRGADYAESVYSTLEVSSNLGIQLDPSNATNAVVTIVGALTPLQFNDSNTEIWEDASHNLTFKDANAGTKTLSDLAPDVGFFGFGGYNSQTIAGGIITAARTYTRVDTEGGGGADDLDTINGGAVGDLLILRINDNARAVTIKDATGNLLLDGSVDFVMNDTQDTIVLMRGSGGPTGGFWMELSRGSPA